MSGRVEVRVLRRIIHEKTVEFRERVFCPNVRDVGCSSRALDNSVAMVLGVVEEEKGGRQVEGIHRTDHP